MQKTDEVIQIGGGVGFAGDRIRPAVDLASNGGLDALILECLGERTIALAQHRLANADGPGWDSLLRTRFDKLLDVPHLPLIVTNGGAADPLGAARMVSELAEGKGQDVPISAVVGDDVKEQVLAGEATGGEEFDAVIANRQLVSANAYIGADSIMPALEDGARIVIGGRIADPSLVVAPAAYLQGFDLSDLDRVARTTLAGHLIECGGQVTGGYFADPGVNDVPGLHKLGFPIAVLGDSDEFWITKAAGTGGKVSAETVKQQLLYEITDPREYITPDVRLNVMGVQVDESAESWVAVTGSEGMRRPDMLKVSVGYDAGFVGRAAVSYRGAQAGERARLAADIISTRTRRCGSDLQIDYLDGYQDGYKHTRVYFSMRSADDRAVRRLLSEVEALGTNGPSGGGGWALNMSNSVGVVAAYLPRHLVHTNVVTVTEK